MIYLDIETIRDPRIPPPHPSQFSAPERWKDEEKIAAKKEELAAAAASKMGLLPTTGRVAMIGLAVDDDEVEVIECDITGDDSELAVLSALDARLRELDPEPPELHGVDWTHQDLVREGSEEQRHAVCSYNGSGFDWPWLTFRCGVHGLHELGARFVPDRKYGSRSHIDPLTYFWSLARGQSGGLTLPAMARAHGYHHRTQDLGKQVQTLWDEGKRDVIRGHLVQDIEALRVVTRPLVRMGVFQPRR